MDRVGLSHYNAYFRYTLNSTDTGTGNTATFPKEIVGLAEKEPETMNTTNANAIDIYQVLKASASYSSSGEVLSLYNKTEIADAYQKELEDAKVNDPEKYQRMILQSKEATANSFTQLLDVSKSNGGIATHNGVSIGFDSENKQMSIGDTSQRGNVISVNLSNGWVLQFNTDNIDDVSKILDLFSPEDVRRIMDAITTDKMAKSKLKEMEDTKASVISETANAPDDSNDNSAKSISGSSDNNEGESEVKTVIVTNPDGSRNLLITTKIGETEMVTNLKIAPAEEENKLLKNQSGTDQVSELHASLAHEENFL